MAGDTNMADPGNRVPEDAPQPLWIFGYGSLIWRPNFRFRESHPARIDGWKRRFWQGSTDHRGVPGAPGRVVTLLEAAAEHCWGVVFRVAEENVEGVLELLDHREQGGYDRLILDAHTKEGPTVRALTWVASRQNENFLGPADLHEIANQVLNSKGPSGPNDHYVLELDASLKAMGVTDQHVANLAEQIREQKPVS